MATVSSGEDVKQVHREPHPFCGRDHLPHFVGKTIAFVGKVDRVEDNILYLKTADESQVKVIKFKGDPNLTRSGSVLEVRGIVLKDNHSICLNFGECTQYDNEFDLGTYESMLGYYHGMCKDLCIK